MQDMLARRLSPHPISLEVHASWAEDRVSVGEITLRRGASWHRYLVIQGDDLNFSDVVRVTNRVPGHAKVLVSTNRITPRTAVALRENDIDYIDDLGNAWVRFGDVLIDVQGRKASRERLSSGPTTGDLFSRKRTQIIFSLLAWPHLWHATLQQLVDTSGTSLGLVHSTLKLLRSAGFEPPQRSSGSLLDLWASAYITNLAPKLNLATYAGTTELRPVEARQPISVSGEVAAARLIVPGSVILYVEEWDPMVAVAHRWRSDAEPNVFIRTRFWREPFDAPHPAPSHGAYQEAPWPIVYADLLADGDPRARQVAQEWRHEHVYPARD